MKARTHTLVWLVLLVIELVLAGSVWQSAVLRDSGVTLEATGLSAFPAIALVVVVNLLALFALRYAGKTLRIILSLALATLTALTLGACALAPLNRVPLLESAIEKATGVAGWSDQVSRVVTDVSDYSVASFAFGVFSIVLVTWICLTGSTKSNTANKVKQESSEDLWVN